jgi:hypothetical protein
MRTVLGAAVCTVLTVLLIGPFLFPSPSRTLRLSGSILLSQIIETNPTPPIEQDPTPPIEKDAKPPIEEDPSPPIEKDPTPPIDENPSPPIEKQSISESRSHSA